MQEKVYRKGRICGSEDRRAHVNRWLIFLIASGLIIGFAGVFVHEPRAIGLGLLMAVAGLWLAIP